MELCEQCDDVHHSALRLVDLPIRNDWNLDFRLLPRAQMPVTQGGHVYEQ